LIRGSFVPPTAVQELRTLTRTRKQLVRERTAHVQRLDKVLPDANLKLGSVLTDIMGQSGRAVLAALVRGETAPEHLATLVSPRVKAARPDIVEALRGHLTSHHRFLLQLHLDQVATLEGAIAKVDAEVGTTLAPFQLAARRLSTIPGVSAVAAAVIMSEIGIDMTRFPTAGHLISWAGLCPKNDASAGKRRSTRLRKGGRRPGSRLRSCRPPGAPLAPRTRTSARSSCV
jgi:transposase